MDLSVTEKILNIFRKVLNFFVSDASGRGNHDPEKMVQAIKEINAGKSIGHTARKYMIPHSTLRSYTPFKDIKKT